MKKSIKLILTIVIIVIGIFLILINRELPDTSNWGSYHSYKFTSNKYKVENDFPRIQENEIRVGVGDVKYSIILSQCKYFIIDVNRVFKIVIP